MKEIIYQNGIEYKYDNKRTAVALLDDGSIAIRFKKLSKDHRPHSIHIVKKDVVETGLVISDEAAMCLINGLTKMLLKKRILKP